MARGGRAGQSGRVAHGRGQEQGDRPPPPRTARRARARGDRPRPRGGAREGGGRPRRGAGRRHRRRPPEARLHVLPSRPLPRGACRADAAPPGRALHRGDREGLPRGRDHDRPAPRAREADARGRRRPVRGAARSGPRRAPLLGPRGPLPDLQRGLRGDRGRRLDAPAALRGGAPAGTRSSRTLAPSEPEVHGLVALMELQASRAKARVGPRGEPVLLLDQDRGRWDHLLIGRGLAALARAEALGRRAGRTRCRPRSPRVTRGRARRGRRTGRGSRRFTAELAGRGAVSRRRAEPRGRGRRWRRGRPRASRSWTRSRGSPRSRTITSCRACAATSSRSWAARDEARNEFERAAALAAEPQGARAAPRPRRGVRRGGRRPGSLRPVRSGFENFLDVETSSP